MWKEYLGRPETSYRRCQAIGALGSALRSSSPEAAISVTEVHISTVQRFWPMDVGNILTAQNNMANCCEQGRHQCLVGAAERSRRRRGAVASTPRSCRVDAAELSRRRRDGYAPCDR